jgi:hypothetical protein
MERLNFLTSPQERSENVASGASTCALVPISNEDGPANLLKTQNFKMHQRAYEPEGREFESLRARQSIKYLGDFPKCLVDGTEAET